MIAEQYRIFGVRIASRRTRRWLVAAYCVLIAACAIGFVVDQTRHGVEDLNPWGLFPMFVGFIAILGGVKAGGVVKPFRGARWTPGDEGGQTLFQNKSMFPEDASELDEREMNERNQVHYRAYTVVRWLTLALFLAYAAIGAWHSEWFPRVGPLFLFMLTLVLWSLPQMLILWTEPDMEEAR